MGYKTRCVSGKQLWKRFPGHGAVLQCVRAAISALKHMSFPSTAQTCTTGLDEGSPKPVLDIRLPASLMGSQSLAGLRDWLPVPLRGTGLSSATPQAPKEGRAGEVTGWGGRAQAAPSVDTSHVALKPKPVLAPSLPEVPTAAQRHAAFLSLLALHAGLGWRGDQAEEDLLGRGLPPALLHSLVGAADFLVSWAAGWGLDLTSDPHSPFRALPVVPGGYVPARTPVTLLIPCLTPLGEVLGAQLKTLDKDRGEDGIGRVPSYVTLGGGRKTAPLAMTASGDLPLHAFVPKQLPVGVCRVCLCEGGLKPAIAAAALQVPFIGAQGGMFGCKDNAWSHQLLIEYLVALERVVYRRHDSTDGRRPMEVVLYPDAGASRNQQVAASFLRTAVAVQRAGWTVRVAWWGQGVKPSDSHLLYQCPTCLPQMQLLQTEGIDPAAAQALAAIFSADVDELLAMSLPACIVDTPLPLPLLDREAGAALVTVRSVMDFVQELSLFEWASKCLTADVVASLAAGRRSSRKRVADRETFPKLWSPTDPTAPTPWDVRPDSHVTALDATFVAAVERGMGLQPLVPDEAGEPVALAELSVGTTPSGAAAVRAVAGGAVQQHGEMSATDAAAPALSAWQQTQLNP